MLLGAIAFVEAALFAFLMRGGWINRFPTIYMAANLYMLVSIVILVAMWAWAVRETLIKKLIVVSFALFYAASQYILINFFTKTDAEIYSLRVVLLYAGSALVMFPVFSAILHKTVRPYLEQIEPQKMKHEFYMILFMTAFYILEMLLIFSSPLSSIEPYWGYVFFSFLFIVTLLCIFYWFLFRESLRRKDEEEKARQYEIQKFEYNRISANMESEQRMRHDFRHHIHILSDMAEENNSEAIKEYLAALSEEAHRFQSERYCANDMVNGILHYYIGCAHDYGIACTVSADCNSDLSVKSTDMTVLLGNTLENAIHSCNEASTKRWIAVKMKTKALKKLLSIILAVNLLLGSVPAVFAADTDNRVTEAPHGQVAPLNPEFLNYIEDGGSGIMPSFLDLSYLAESYLLQSRQTYARLPARYDLRDIGKVSPVINQGDYGTCWAVSTMGSAESGLIEQFPDISLSIFHLVWFTYAGDEEREIAQSIGWDTSDPFQLGGNDNFAVASLAAWKGPVYSEKAPYGVEEIDESLRYHADYHLQDAFYLPSSLTSFGAVTPVGAVQMQTVKQIIMENGATGIHYYVHGDDTYFNEETNAYYCDAVLYPNHEVLIVGWDDSYPKENFNEGCRPENDGAWLLRNSWGTEWGDEGYFWLSYEDKNINYSPFYKLESKDNYAENYQYDTTGWGTSISADEFINADKASKTGYMSNVFTAESNEQLEAVSFYTTDAGTEYEISVYTGVRADEPTSGTLAYSGQSGMELYAGYHTIELNEAVKLKAGENFSVVVRLKNPSYPYAIPVEFCLLPWEMETPDYMGSGGESYYSADGKVWADVTEICDVMDTDEWLCVTNVCLKAFTNPLPDSNEAVSNIRFSVLEGPVTDDSMLELEGTEEIYYTINGGVPQLYNENEPVILDVDGGDCTVTAWGQKNGKKGNAVSRTYIKASSKLIELDVEYSDSLFRCDLSQADHTFTIALDHETEMVKIRPRGADIITVNGQPVSSDDWSDEIAVSEQRETTVEVVSSADGKDSTTYTLKLYRRAISYDYRAETVSYDDSIYLLKDGLENIIPNGGSVTAYIGTDLRLTDLAGNFLHIESVPARNITTASPIDFENEQTLYIYGEWNKIADNPEMENATQWTGGYIPVTPGQVLYVQKDATDTAFTCEPARIDIPASRPATPDIALVEAETTCIEVTELDGALYRIAPDGEWQYDCVFDDLESDTEYTVEVCIAPTDVSFASGIAELHVRTLSGTTVYVSYCYEGEEYLSYEESVSLGENTIFADEESLTEVGFKLENPENNTAAVNVTAQNGVYTADPETVVFDIVPSVDPKTVFFEISYWDRDGNRIPGDGRQSFDTVFEMSREDIVLPEGYQLLAVEDPDEAWLYPVGLYYSGGAWRPILNRVQLQIEKMASITVLFQLEDGTVLEGLGYALTYGTEGTEQVEITTPQGYKIIGNDRFTVRISRDAAGNLISDFGTINVTVKKNGGENPAQPGNPDESGATQKNDGNGDTYSAQTGDDSNFILWVVCLFVSLAGFVSISVYRKKEKNRNE